MNTLTFLLVGVVLAAATAATASTPPAPPVAPVSSATVEVHQPTLKYEHGTWRLSGCVAPRRGVAAQLAAHVDVVSLDASGARLGLVQVPLKAAALRLRPRAPRPHARFELALDSLSPATARIEVRAHDHANHQP